MDHDRLIVWEDRLTRLTFLGLCLATGYGIVAGAGVTMYYDIVPDMGAIEDRLATPLFLFYITAVLLGFGHLLLVVGDIKARFWKQALGRTAIFLGPILVFLGAEGLLAHLLWWNPISDTDRYHLLHHSVMAGVPLTLLFGLGLWRWWQPAALKPTGTISRKSWILVGTALFGLVAVFSIMTGVIPLPLLALMALVGIVVLPILWWRENKKGGVSPG